MFFSMLLISALAANARTPVILSADVGNEIDDQWAVVYMLTNPALDVLGIVSAHAPTVPDPSAHHTYRVLADVIENHMKMAVHPPTLRRVRACRWRMMRRLGAMRAWISSSRRPGSNT